MELLLPLLGIVVSMLIIWKACDGFEAGASYLGRNLTEGVKGATINAIGSSIPELLTATIALLIYVDKDGFAFGLGTTAGSAIFNSAIIPALVIITVVGFIGIGPIKISRKVILRDGISLLIAELVLILLLASNTLTWWHGLALMAIYGAYIFYMFATMPESEKEVEDYIPSKCWGVKVDSLSKSLFMLTLAIILISGACHVLVEACYDIGEILNVKVYFISVILAAAATSVPDTILSIKDAKNGEYDDSISNALGSNIFDICVCIGLPLFLFCLITGQSISIGVGNEGSILDLRILLFFSTFLVFIVMLSSRFVGLFSGFLLLSIYGFFVSRIVFTSGIF